ncbi:MAG: TatD family hydrolase [Candidatus Micrarchaeota archaeon]|nr:TatD family hydrolase [Candidatus Micrarchaeota archaeon]
MGQYSQMMAVERTRTRSTLEFSDAHCHLNLFENPADTVREAREKGVGTIITAGGSAKDNFECARIAEREGVFAVIGIGPDFATSDSGYVVEIEGLVRNSMKIVGIGEIGIDTKVADKNSMELQRELFRKQVGVAKELNLPIVIHARGAVEEVANTIIEMQVRKALFHFFEGDEKQALELSKRGYLISIPPAMTGRRKRIINELGLSSIVVETDSPVVGKTPADVIGVCETIAKLKGVSLEEVAAKTTENIRSLFYI